MDASALLGSDPHDDDNEMSHLLLLEEGNASSAARARSASHAHASGRAPPGVSPGAPFDEDATWIEARGVRRDRFLNAVHHYFAEKGLNHALLARFLNTLTLAFSLGFSALILLYIDWGAIVGERAYDACARFATQSHETPAQACDAVKLGYLHHAPLRRLSSAMQRSPSRILQPLARTCCGARGTLCATCTRCFAFGSSSCVGSACPMQRSSKDASRGRMCLSGLSPFTAATHTRDSASSTW